VRMNGVRPGVRPAHGLVHRYTPDVLEPRADIVDRGAVRRPEPEDGADVFGELAKPKLAFAERGFGPSALSDVLRHHDISDASVAVVDAGRLQRDEHDTAVAVEVPLHALVQRALVLEPAQTPHDGRPVVRMGCFLPAVSARLLERTPHHRKD